MYRTEGSERNLAKVESFLYIFLKLIGSAYSISDLRKLIKWNPENISTLRQKFLYNILENYYWKGHSDVVVDIRKWVLDLADGKMLNSAVKYLAELGVIKMVHEEGNDGREVGLASSEDYARLSADVDSKKLKNYVAKYLTKPAVQSNLEVIVSLLGDFQLVRNLIHGCELLSASKRIVFRITEKSLRFYANNLGDLNALLALLSRMSPYDIPENVSQIVMYIAAHSSEVTVRKCAGILVFRDNFLMKKAMSGRTFSKINKFAISDNVPGIIDASYFEKKGKTLGDVANLYRIEENAAVGNGRMPAGRHRRRCKYSEDWEDSLE